MYWRVLVETLRKRGPDAASQLSAFLPDAVQLVALVEDVAAMRPQPGLARACRARLRPGRSRTNPRTVTTLNQLLKLCICLDFGDEVGRQKTEAFARECPRACVRWSA